MSDEITVIITSSPCKRHPSTEMIFETIKLIRKQLTSKIIILLDGVKPEQEYLRDAYEQYKVDLMFWLTAQDNIEAIAFPDFQHQTGMIKNIIPTVKTPFVLFIEHDFPVVGHIPWNNIGNVLRTGKANLVRFYLEDKLIPQHRHMFVNQEPELIDGVPLIKTSQWSQRPHICHTQLYRQIVDQYITGNKTYIEDDIHGRFAIDFTQSKNPEKDWGKHKLTIYSPRGNISRCKHLDGRMEERKYGLE